MPYENLNTTLNKPAFKYINNNWVHSEETNFFKKQVLARGASLVLTPWSAITSAADTIVGVGAGLASIATGGKCFRFAMNHLDSSQRIIARPYGHLLYALNPNSRFSNDAFIKFEGNGFITHYVNESLMNLARDCLISDNFLKKHVASRLTYVLLALCSVITRVVDGIIGVIAAIFSFLTLGKVESINNLAYRALQAPGIIKDLFYCTSKCINPWVDVNVHQNVYGVI